VNIAADIPKYFSEMMFWLWRTWRGKCF